MGTTITANLAAELPAAGPPYVPRVRKPRKRPGHIKKIVKHRPSVAKAVRLITLRHIDQRSVAFLRAKELLLALEKPFGTNITPGARQLCQRAAVLGAIIEDFEARLLVGEAIEIPDYLATVSTQRRVLQALGVRPPKGPVGRPGGQSKALLGEGSDLGDYLSRQAGANVESAERPEVEAGDSDEEIQAPD